MKIRRIISDIIVVILIVAALLLVGARVFGLRTYTVLSGSMEPTYHVGSLVYVKPVDKSELQAGDAISFMMDENTVATHRIIEVVPDADDPDVVRFRTQGDANDTPDGSPVHYKNVIGKVVFSIPGIGYVSEFAKRPPGLYVVIALAVVLLIIAFMPDGSGKKDKETDNTKEKKKEGSNLP